MTHIVTRESLIKMVSKDDPAYVAKVVGRALVALYDNQTAEEKGSTMTKEDNSIGFTGADAHSGSITARYFLKHQTLLEWQLEQWTKPNTKGIPRIAKYWKQLDEVAQRKIARAQTSML